MKKTSSENKDDDDDTNKVFSIVGWVRWLSSQASTPATSKSPASKISRDAVIMDETGFMPIKYLERQIQKIQDNKCY